MKAAPVGGLLDFDFGLPVDPTGPIWNEIDGFSVMLHGTKNAAARSCLASWSSCSWLPASRPDMALEHTSPIEGEPAGLILPPAVHFRTRETPAKTRSDSGGDKVTADWSKVSLGMVNRIALGGPEHPLPSPELDGLRNATSA